MASRPAAGAAGHPRDGPAARVRAVVQRIGGRTAPPGGLDARTARPDVPHDRRPARVRGGGADPRGERRGGRPAGEGPVRVRRVRRRRGQSRLSFLAPRPATALPFRFADGRALAASTRWDQAARRLVPPRARRRDRRARRGADDRLGPAVPVPSLGALGDLDWRADRGGQRVPRRVGRRPGRARRRARRADSTWRRPALQPEHGGASLPRTGLSGSRTSATSATCGSSTRCGPGCRCSSPRALRRAG